MDTAGSRCHPATPEARALLALRRSLALGAPACEKPAPAQRQRLLRQLPALRCRCAAALPPDLTRLLELLWDGTGAGRAARLERFLRDYQPWVAGVPGDLAWVSVSSGRPPSAAHAAAAAARASFEARRLGQGLGARVGRQGCTLVVLHGGGCQLRLLCNTNCVPLCNPNPCRTPLNGRSSCGRPSLPQRAPQRRRSRCAAAMP